MRLIRGYREKGWRAEERPGGKRGEVRARRARNGVPCEQDGGGGGKSLSALIAVIKFENLPDPPPTKILRLRISNRPRLTPDIAARAQADYFQALSGEPFRRRAIVLFLAKNRAPPNRLRSSLALSNSASRAIARALDLLSHFRAVSRIFFVGIRFTARRAETRLSVANGHTISSRH